MSTRPQTGADALVRRLRQHGVKVVFGYPGGQLTPIYDAALTREPGIRHILARDEQAAAFMADGYARATGKPGVCLAVCGPGVYNAATALATAYTDSIPVLVISGQVPCSGLGLRSGYYHENDQLHAVTTLTKWRTRVSSVAAIVPQVDQGLMIITRHRPGPGLLEVPLDLLRAEFQTAWPAPPTSRPADAIAPLDDLANLLASWKRPILLAGGGVLSASATASLVQVAERLNAPVFTTLNGKSAFPGDHPLAMGMPWKRVTSDVTNMEPLMSPLWAQADGVLAIGCRFTQATTGSWALPIRQAQIAQIDVDPAEIGRHYPVALGVPADARQALEAVLAKLPTTPRTQWAQRPPREPWNLLGMDVLGPLREKLPRDAIIAADITRLSYQMLTDFPVYRPRTFLHPAGFVPMGYGIPAALGAKAAFPDRPVVAVAGDGCFLMSGMELATAVQEKLPILTILVNDSCLTLIKATQERRYESRFIGVELRNPDFGKLCEAFGVRHWLAETGQSFARGLDELLKCGEPALIEVKPGS